MILDTNALSAFADGDRGILPALKRATLLAVPVIVLGEFYFGIRQSRHRKAYEKWIEENMPLWKVLDVTRRTAKFYGEVRAELKQAGTPIPENDVWIASLAREHALPVLTRDEHFDRVAKLAVVSW